MALKDLNQAERELCRWMVEQSDAHGGVRFTTLSDGVKLHLIPMVNTKGRGSVETTRGQIDALEAEGLVRRNDGSPSLRQSGSKVKVKSGSTSYSVLPTARRAVERNFEAEPLPVPSVSNIYNTYGGNVQIAGGNARQSINVSAEDRAELVERAGKLCESVLALLEDLPPEDLAAIRRDADQVTAAVQAGDRPGAFTRLARFAGGIIDQLPRVAKGITGGKKIVEAIGKVAELTGLVDLSVPPDSDSTT